MTLELMPLSEEHVAACARLLAARHRRRRRAEPLLPERFEDEGAARRALGAVMREATGAVELADGEVAGFLLARPSAEEDPWPPSSWVLLPGHAALGDDGPGVYRALYAHLAAGWVDRGLLDHYIRVPAADGAALEAWFSLGFGREQVHALRALGREGPAGAPPGTVLRPAGLGDLDAVAPLVELIARHQAASPVFAPSDPAGSASLRAGHAELLADDATGYWIATDKTHVLSYCVIVPAPESDGDMGVPPRCAELTVAATRPEARGRGVGTALARRALAWAGEQGYECCIADWRSANAPASRTWLGLGFRAIEYRLHRTIDARVAPTEVRY